MKIKGEVYLVNGEYEVRYNFSLDRKHYAVLPLHKDCKVNNGEEIEFNIIDEYEELNDGRKYVDGSYVVVISNLSTTSKM